MPLLYLSFKKDSPNRQGNNFTFVLPNEIPAQMAVLRDCTIVLSGDENQYGTEVVSTVTVQRPKTRFNNMNGSRLWLQFRNADILNSRQILSTNLSQAGKIPLPLDYAEGRKKTQYNYIEQTVHIHGVDRDFQISVFLDDGATPANFDDKTDNVTNNIALVDLVLEYDDVV